MRHIVVAYSGEQPLPPSSAWSIEGAPVGLVTVTVDLGQSDDLEAVRDRALAQGAVRAHVLDARDEFARCYVLPALQADVVLPTHGTAAPIPFALGRPLVGKLLVEVAELEGAACVAQGGSARLTAAVDARGSGRPVLQFFDRRADVDANLWGRTWDGGLAGGDAVAAPPDHFYRLTRPAAACPDEPAFVEIAFERGVPTAINGVAMSLVDLISSLTLIAGAHGVGRFDLVDRRPDGTSVALAGEAPAAVVLHEAYRRLRAASRGDAAAAEDVSRRYADIVSNGRWFSPDREALDALVRSAREDVTGAVRLKLFKGHHQVHDNAVVRTI